MKPRTAGIAMSMVRRLAHFKKRLKDMRHNKTPRRILRSQLNRKQRHAHDGVVRSIVQEETSATDSGDGIGRLQLLLGKGGCGKSYVLDAVLTTLADEHGINLEEVAVFGTTGKTACLIQGSNVHSWSEGLCFPRDAKDFQRLKGKSERQFQDRMTKIRAIFIDELSMLQQVQLFFIDQRHRQAFPERSDMFFGGVPVILIGDPGQLPPVGDAEMWKATERPGHALWQQFTTVYQLESNNRIDQSDPLAKRFEELLGNVYNGTVTKDDVEFLRDNCSRLRMGDEEWKRRGFTSDEATHLCPTNEKVLARNHKVLKKYWQSRRPRKSQVHQGWPFAEFRPLPGVTPRKRDLDETMKR